MEQVKQGNSKGKAVLMGALAITVTSMWLMTFTQSAHARGAVVAARAAPVASVARSAPAISATRSKPVAPVMSPAVMPKSSKNCNLATNKNSKECKDKKAA